MRGLQHINKLIIKQMVPDKIPDTVPGRIEYLSHCTSAEWESLCKGCGLCCLCKYALRDGVCYSRMACNWLDLKTHHCTIYAHRNEVPFCNKISVDMILHDGVLPDTCGYREFIFGKSHKKISVDFSDVIHLQDAHTKKIEFIKMLIPESINWCGRQR